MTDFRVFVEKPIGKILTLFDVFSATLWGGVSLWSMVKMIEKSEISTCQPWWKWMKKYKKNSFFSIHNVNLKKSVDNFCSIVKLHFLKTKIQNRIYRDFEHHFLTNFGKIIFLKIPYIWEFYGFFRKKNKKTRIFNLLIHCIFNIFLRKKSKNDFFSYCVGTCTYRDFDSI